MVSSVSVLVVCLVTQLVTVGAIVQTQV
jgi:hypothetical protein